MALTYSSAAIAQTSALDIEPMVTEVPEGSVATVYTMEATSWSGENLQVVPTSISGYKTILYSHDNQIYWGDPIYNHEAGTYLVGEKKDNEIVFSFPQTFYTDTFQGETGVIYFYPFTYNAEYNAFMHCDKPEVKCRISEDGVITFPSDITIGAAYEGAGGGYAWAGAGIGSVEFTPFTAVPVTAPEGLKFEDWVLEETFSTTPRFVKVGFSGNDVYFKGFSKTCPEFTFKGTIDGNKVICEPNQYLGEYADHFFIRFMTANWAPEADRTDRTDPDLVLCKDNFVFTLNNDKSALRTENPETLFIFSASDKVSYPIVVIENPYIYDQGEIDPKTPLPAYDLNIITSDWVYSSTDFLTFSIYDYNSKKQTFPRANLYYEIIVDGEPFSFTRRNGYPNLKESITQIPVDLSNSYFTSGLKKDVAFKTRDYSTLGVRLLYVDYDGTTYYSPISYFPNLDPSGISETDMSQEEISVEYYDLTGKQVDANDSGIIIRKAVMSDGKINVTKKINR